MSEPAPDIVVIGEILVGLEGSKWQVKSFLGAGAFGAIVVAINLVTGNEAALKLEDANQEVRTLRQEVEVLDELMKANAKHCCTLYDRGRKDDRYNWVAMSLVGESVQKLVDERGHFTIGTSLWVALGTLEGLEELHNVGYLHRDVKPGNFAIGRPPNVRKIIVLDFGMARKYIKKDGRHRRARDVAGFRGTPYYASPVALLMGEQGRRDDMWAWFFMAIEFTTGSLPWEFNDYEAIEDPVAKLTKMGNDRQALLNGNGETLLHNAPKEFSQIFTLLKQLDFADKPPYPLIYSALLSVYTSQGLSPRSPLDYEKVSSRHGNKKKPKKRTKL
uniref:Protein kinase domain-containing protein n=1 Tax=Trichuris muris TaxID=70415 RepID=A0A5S6QS38_TRIMR